MRVAVTGGIACGKSLFSKYLNEFGVETIDADDVVHDLIPADERRRLAKVVFEDEAARKALEARLHPLVRRRIDEWFGEGSGSFKSMLTSYASLGESISYSFSNEPRTRVITVTIL